MDSEVPIKDIAKKWLEQDHDPETRKEIETFIQNDDELSLEKALRYRIAFGTAGLRAAMKAGYAYMNSLTVAQASQGLADYVLCEIPKLEQPKVVIGYDGRYNSDKFARLAAAAFIAKGLRVLWFGKLVHTPMVPFAVRHFGASAGVMVTASHNPKNDNGYKVYWSNGSQIIPPHDRGIASFIDSVDHVLDWNTSTVDESPLTTNVFDETLQNYLQTITGLASNQATVRPPINFTYTAMHGVGLPFMQAAARIAGVDSENFHIVQAQAQPDPEFSTVPFPNPEEKGALNLAIQEAEKTGTTLVLANDPDADRFSVAEKLPNGTWHQFSGNQIGVLLASHVLSTTRSQQQQTSSSSPPLAMLASTVSSRMLASMARAENFHFQETLTGFKWLGNIGQQLASTNHNVVFAYEEAIGFMFPRVVWDKDGIAAATAFITASRIWQSRDSLTPFQKLQSLYQKYGYFEDANTYLISPSPAVTNKVFNAIRTLDQGARPKILGRREIQRWRDLTLGYDTAAETKVPDLPVDASAQMITCELDGVIFTIRGSGTEPKIKLYIEGTAASADAARAMALEVLQDLLTEWFKPESNGLRLANAL